VIHEWVCIRDRVATLLFTSHSIHAGERDLARLLYLLTVPETDKIRGSYHLSLEDPAKAGPGIGGGSHDGHSNVPDVWQ
jgi:hypothetical protein